LAQIEDGGSPQVMSLDDLIDLDHTNKSFIAKIIFAMWIQVYSKHKDERYASIAHGQFGLGNKRIVKSWTMIGLANKEGKS
jgi:hypothetical protein